MKKLWNQYKVLMRKQFIGSHADKTTDIDYWRTRLFIQFLLYTFPVGIVVYIPSMMMSVVTGLIVIAVVDTITLALIILLVFSKKISIQTKKYLLAICLYLLSVVLLLVLGSIGPGLIYLVATSVFIILVIGKKAAYFSVFLNLGLYCLLSLSLAFPEIGIEFLREYTLGAWIAVGANFLFINIITVASIALLLDGLQKTILNEKRLLNKLKKERKKLNEAKDKAIQSDKFKSVFLANMSHEIRTPLNAIVGFANLLLKNKGLNHQKRYIELITNSSKHLLNLINDVIDISKIEAGAVSMKIERVKLNDFIHGIAASMKQLCPKHLEFKFSANEDDLYTELGIDTQKVTQVITNLITNSFKYTKKGSVELNAVLPPDQKIIYFSIIDTGIGISKEKQKKVFQRFYQENAMHSGVGLGLSICASLVKIMDGEIAMKSEIDIGSTFTVKIPNFIEKVQNKPAILPQENKAEVLSFCNKKILIAEDDENSYTLLKDLLEEERYLITHSKNGDDAIKQAKSNKFDIVFMDMKMPILDGYEATRQIRLFDAKIPIVAVTAFAFNADAEKAFKAGCNDYLTKPVDFEKLKLVLAKHIN